MTVQEAIQALSQLDPEDEIIAAWWEYDAFSDSLTKEQWEEHADSVEYKMDWSQTHNDLERLLLERVAWSGSDAD
jgi:hypothetical protein